MLRKLNRKSRRRSATGDAKWARSKRLVMEQLEIRRVLQAGPLVISEFMADNDGTLADGDGDFSDWIEIHNLSASTLSLNGFYLTDDAADPTKWQFPATTIGAGEYLIVFASGKTADLPPGELHANFQLDADGEYLALVEADGSTVAHAFAPQFPEQLEDVSFGLTDATTTWDTLITSGADVSYHLPTAGDDPREWTTPDFDDSSWTDTITLAPAAVVVTEIDTGGTDWFEIQNVSDQAVNTSGWFVAVNDASSSDISDVHGTVWSLPASVAAGEVLYRTDDPGDNYFGTPISWSTGSGWVLIVDDAGRVADFLVWGYSEAEIDTLSVDVGGFVGVTAGGAWRGAAVASDTTQTELIDIQARWSYEQSNTDLGAGWRAPGYNDSAWPDGRALLYVEGSALPAPKNTPLTLGASTYYFRTHFNLDADPASVTQLEINTVLDDGAVFYLNGQEVRRLGMGSGAFNHFTYANRTVGNAGFEGPFAIPTGALLAGDNVFAVEVHQTNSGSSDIVMGLDLTATVLEPSLERTGNVDVNGSDDFVAAAATTKGTQNPAMTVPFVSGSLPALTGVGFSDDAGFESIRTDVAAAMQGVSASLWSRVEFIAGDTSQFDELTLRMKYDDGYAAYLNGVEVARRNAPDPLRYNSAATEAHPDTQAMVFEDVDISDFLHTLRPLDTNVLAIHGLNVDAADGDFLILPELIATSLLDDPQYMTRPTPGAANVAGSLGWVEDTRFSVDRGFYDAPFDLEITTDTLAAEIRYTTDGSEPTATQGTVYSGPITIDRTTTLRAAAFKSAYIPTNIDTQTYIFIADVVQQSPGGAAPGPGWPTGSVNGQSIVYGMDPDIVNHATWGPQMADALTAIPSMSIVTDLDNLFDSSTGIFVNPRGDGRGWERPTSLELIYPPDASGPGFPDGADEGFQIDAGLRIRGGYSRSGNNPKHAFRLFFRREYGAGKLNYPLFGSEGVDKFDKFDLRTSQNYSWAFGGPNNNTMVREVFSRDLQGEMGQPYTRSRYYHLYLNGQYWGIFMTQERTEARFAASYMGGDPEDYDAIKQNDSREIFATDGNLAAYRRLWQKTINGFSDDVAYYRAQGLNPDGTPNPAYEKLLDVDNLIDYMVITYYTGDRDGPGSRYTTPRPNNYAAIYNRANPDGWKFFEHDSEHSLGTGENNMVEPLLSGDSRRAEFRYFNAHWLHEQLSANDNYARRFADRLFQHFSGDGVLTDENALAKIDARAAQIDTAIIAESARWGDTKTNPPRNRNHWLTDVGEVRSWITGRTGTVIGQVRNVGWYPNVDGPDFNQPGGIVPPDFELLMGAPSGRIWYTLDGTDPRADDGSISPTAVEFISSTTTEELIAIDDRWSYNQSGNDLGTAWRQPGYGDGGWPTGDALLYVESSGLPAPKNTPLTLGPITYYFRKHFTFNGDPANTTLRLRTVIDDGAVFYLNGSELRRLGVQGGAFNYMTTANRTVTNAAYEGPFDVPTDALVQGDNVIAVEVHQTGAGSSDIVFGIELNAVTQTAAVPVVLTESTLVSARAQNAGQWSAMGQAQFIVGVPAAADNLAVTEINYDPYAPAAAEIALGFLDNDEFEFVELQNTSDRSIDLTSVRFTDGIEFDFTGGDVIRLDAGEFVVVVKDPDAFEARYGVGVNVAGTFDLGLANQGEGLTLLDWTDAAIADFSYDNTGNWPGRAAGKGASLELIDPAAVPVLEPDRTDYLEDGDSWRSSSEYGGSPGAAGSGPIGDVLVNEVLTHTDPPQFDSIELINTTASAIDVGGWYLSDSWGWESDEDNGNYKKYRIPGGTTIAPGGYMVFDENDFNPVPENPLPTHFALNGAHGDDVWLMEADAAMNLTRFVDHVEFDAAANGESFGRWPNGSGELYPMTEPTLDKARPENGANSGPRVGPLIISELHYNLMPGGDDDDLEFIEIYNSTAASVDMSHWKLADGIEYSFPDGTELGPFSTLVVLPFSLSDGVAWSAFCAEYGLDRGQPEGFLGGYDGQLSNGGERVQLLRPDEPPQGEPDFYPMLLEDEVRYDDAAPWPTSADAGGDSLSRTEIDAWGNSPVSWTAAAPSPSEVDFLLPQAQVVGRWVFYNESTFDGNDETANPLDDDAMAPDKTALLPGQTATSANYTSFSFGINGLMIDVDGLPAEAVLDGDDFQFRTGNSSDPASWPVLAETPEISIRRGQGIGGSDRVTLVWPNNTIAKQWLQVTVGATADTGLPDNDVFYFGNAIGETGNSAGPFPEQYAKVNAFDMLGARDNQRNFLNPAPIDFPFDFNRDARVNATDMLIARNHPTHFLNALKLITVPGGKAAGEQASAGGGRAAQDAVFRQAVELQPQRPAAASSKLDWLHEFDPISAQQGPSKRDPSGEAAADEVLAMNLL